MTFETTIAPIAILIVEDDVLVRMVAGDILTDAGFRVHEADDASEAVTLLEARTDIRVVFTDWNMPGDMDGIDLAHLVSKRWPKVGILVTSGKMHPNPWDLPAGVQFLAKPYRPLALIEVVKAVAQASDEIAPGALVLPERIMMHSPVRAEVGGLGIVAGLSGLDKI